MSARPVTPPPDADTNRVLIWLQGASVSVGLNASPPKPRPVSRWNPTESSSSSNPPSDIFKLWNYSSPLAPITHPQSLAEAPASTSDKDNEEAVDKLAEAVKMTDPFEVRMRFSSQLQNLNASVVSQQKAATYALKYKDMDEDLHSCILEQLERTNVNTRANIMFFIEHFLDSATKEGHGNYVKMMQRDIIRVVDAVAPDDGSGAANVKIVRLVLQGLQIKGFLDDQTVTEIEDVIKERETSTHAPGLSSPVEENGPDNTLEGMPPSQLIPKPDRSVPPRLDKRTVEQRIEEDRERHKRDREKIWYVGNREEEIDRLWEETSDLGEDDHIMGREEFLAREAAIAQQCPHYTPRTLEDLYANRL